MIHARCVAGGVGNYQTLLEQIFNALRPGGILLIFEGQLGVLDSNSEAITVTNDEDPVCNRLFWVT